MKGILKLQVSESGFTDVRMSQNIWNTVRVLKFKLTACLTGDD